MRPPRLQPVSISGWLDLMRIRLGSCFPPSGCKLLECSRPASNSVQFVISCLLSSSFRESHACRIDGGSEAGRWACVPVEAGELASLEAVSETSGRDASVAEQESLEAALPVAGRLDAAQPPDARTCGLVQSDVRQPDRPRSAGRCATRRRPAPPQRPISPRPPRSKAPGPPPPAAPRPAGPKPTTNPEIPPDPSF